MSWRSAATTYSSSRPSPVARRQGRRLEAVGQSVDGKAAVVAVEESKLGEHAVGHAVAEIGVVASDDLPVFFGSVLHLMQGGTEFGLRFGAHGSLLSGAGQRQPTRVRGSGLGVDPPGGRRTGILRFSPSSQADHEACDEEGP